MLKFIVCFICFFALSAQVSTFGQNDPDSTNISQMDSGVSEVPVQDSAWHAADRLHRVPTEEADRYLKDPDFEYANDPEYWLEPTPQPVKPVSSGYLLFLRIFRWMLLLGIGALAIWGIVALARENNFRWFSRKSTSFNGDGVEDKMTEVTDFEREITKYQNQENYRMALRYLYLRLLYVLKSKQVIPYRSSSTNSEIATAMGNHPQREEFRYLTRIYEYAFYGGFLPGPENYHQMKKRFDDIQRNITN